MSEFNLVTVADNEPLSNDNFYKWLDTFGKRAIPQNPIVAYLETLGFVVGRDSITEGQHKTLEYVVDTFYRCEPETKREFSVDELFPDTGFFYVKGAEGKRKISQDLRELVNSSGWVYDVTPETTFFEIIDNRLLAKYQQILGSRFICRLKQYPKVTVYRRGWYDKVNGYSARYDEEAVNRETEREAENLVDRLASWLYSQLRNEVDYQSSDEYVDDAITANEYEFYENGERV